MVKRGGPLTVTTMFRPVRRLLGAGLAALLGLGTAASQAQVAVVIGNSAYAALPRLPGCEMSASLATAALTRAGFRVSQLLNPSNARMGAAIATLGDEAAATPAVPAVIYVCGYVATYADRLFLLPVDSKLERDTDVLTQGIVARLLMSAATAGGAALVLMDVAGRPGTDMAAVAAMVRPADLAHVGFAAAQVTPMGDQIAAPLASALADMLRSGHVELAGALGGLPADPALAKARLLAVRPPSNPSWLLGKATPPAIALAIPAAMAASPPVVQRFAEPNPAERRRLQLALQRLGYFQGRVTGQFGADTEAAIRTMQRESSEPATGRLTAEQAGRLLDH